MSYIDLFDENDIKELNNGFSPNYSGKSLDSYPRKTYVPEDISKEIIRLMTRGSYN